MQKKVETLVSLVNKYYLCANYVGKCPLVNRYETQKCRLPCVTNDREALCKLSSKLKTPHSPRGQQQKNVRYMCDEATKTYSFTPRSILSAGAMV